MGGLWDFVVPRGAPLLAANFTNHYVPAEDEDLCVIDLRGAKWVEPGGLVAVAAFADDQVSLGRELYLEGPDNFHVGNYVSRMRLGRVVDELGGQHDLASVGEHAVERPLLEVTRFADEVAVERLAELALDALAPEHPSMADALFEALCEVGSNVSQHSGRPYGYMAAQPTWGGTQVRLAVADAGVGIAGSLEQVGIHDQVEAVERVLSDGVSRTGDPARGRGLPRTREVLTSLGGSLFLATGTVQRTAHERALYGRHMARPFPGTLMEGLIRVDR